MATHPSPLQPVNSRYDVSSVTGLIGALCDRSLSGVSWKRRGPGGVSRESFRRDLKKRAYGALLSKLFQDGSKVCGSAPGILANTPARNKVLMICFDLRVAGCREEAERLEEQLERLPEGVSSGLREVDAALELLVNLAGSVPPPPTSFSRDYMRRERPVLRRPQPWGYQSEELQRLEARAWGLICGEEWGSLESVHGAQRLMDAPPGTGLFALRTATDAEERFEKETRMTLFGALQHTRTSDMDIRLDLPPVPSNIDVTGLTIRVPPCIDQSEDEGFQSASNLTPDSQSEASPSPELDIWEALRTFKPGVRRSWETIGWPPGNRESLYLTEAGREAFDQLYRLLEGEIRLVSSGEPSPDLPLPLASQTQLVSDTLNVLIGVASTTFPLNQSVQFDVRPGVRLSGTSPESVARLLGELAQYGTHYLRLSRFSQQSVDKRGLVFQAFTGGLRKYLHYYRACVLSTPPTLTLLTISFHFRKLGRQLRYLSELCCVDGPLGTGQATFPVGVKLLSYLYNEALNNCSNENYLVLLSLLRSSCEPYTRFVSDWVYSGVFRDVYGEFMIQVNEEYLSFRDKQFWVQGYTLISKDVEDCVPIFLRHIANDVYVCGKTINLLKICCPQHYICMSELPVPRIAVTFSLQEVEEIERDCAVYRGRMETIAKHSAVSREEQALRTERARQELINQVRVSAVKTLESIRGRQVSQRLAEEARKRERFEELRQHLEQEQEWRSAARQKQEEDDFSFARELRDREKRLQALEEQLEQRARKELIAQYSSLSEEAARRERRAMWRVQRMRLDEARARFFMHDRQQLQLLLQEYPLGQKRLGVEVLPSLPPAETTPPRSTMESHSAELSEDQPAETQEAEAVTSPPPPSRASTLDTAEADIFTERIDVSISLPKSPAPDGQQVDTALQEIGSDLPEACPTAQPVDYDFSAPFSPLEGITCQAPGQARPHWEPQAFPFGQASESSFPFGQLTSEEPQKTMKTSAYLSQTSAQVVRAVDGSVMPNPPEDGALHTVSASTPEKGLNNVHLKGGMGLSSSGDTRAQSSDYPVNGSESPSKETYAPSADQTIGVSPDVLAPQSVTMHGDKSDLINTDLSNTSVLRTLSTIATLDPNDKSVDGPELCAPPPNTTPHRHSSDTHIKVGENTSEFVPPLPAQSVHSHSSDAIIKVGDSVLDVAEEEPGLSKPRHASDCILQPGCLVSGTEPTPSSLPRSAFGHPSSASLGVGFLVSGQEAQLSPLPGSAHGHSSDSSLGIGCVVSKNEPSSAPLPGSAYGHSSDSTLGVGCVVPAVEPQPSALPGSAYGHSSDSTLGVGCVVPAVEPQPSALPGSAYGHSSDSTLGVGCVVPAVEPQPSALPGSAYGHSSDSTLGAGCVVPGVEPQPSALPGSAYGHSSDSTLGVGCVVPGVEPQPSALPGSAYGHSSDSTLGVGCMVLGRERQPSALPGSAYGHSSDSTLGVGCMVLGVEPPVSELPGRAFGHSSDSALGVGCLVLVEEPPNSALPGSAYGHSSDSSLGAGCVVTNRGRGDQPVGDDDKGLKPENPGEQPPEFPGEKSEMEYLLALSAQYQVEHYEDSYNLMASSPECQLLKQVTRGPCSIPADPALGRATDTTAVQLSEMVSLPVLIKHSVTTPLITHLSLVNKAVVDYFFVELGVERHFEALRHFLLMEDGEFAQSLSDRLFEKLGSGQTPGELLTPLVLNSILSKALQYGLHGDGPLAGNFTFALRFLPDTFHPHAPDSLNCLELRYKVDWPLNIIITDSCMNKYNRLFSFLLQLKHMVWSLRDVWFHLKRTALVKGAGAGRSVQFRQLQLYRHEMQHFVKVIQGYIANQILQVSWSEFTAKLATASDLDAIHRTHADYLNRAIFRGLLTEKAAPVMNIIHSIFSLILKFRAQLIAQPWADQQGEAVHPSFIAMQQSYNTFKYYSHFLFKVVTKLVNRGYQPHLEDFLLRINFNNYYKDS